MSRLQISAKFSFVLQEDKLFHKSTTFVLKNLCTCVPSALWTSLSALAQCWPIFLTPCIAEQIILQDDACRARKLWSCDSILSKLINCTKVYYGISSGFCRAVTATQRVHGWRIVEWSLDIDASCEISGNLPANKQSRTNSGLSTRVQEVGGWHHHPYETLQMPYDGEVTWRVQAANQ